MLRRKADAALPLLLLLAVACAGSEEERLVVAWVGGDPQHLDALQTYLDANLVADEEGEVSAASGLNEAKSRLFDAFIDERLLLSEAETRAIEVSDLELEVYLGLGREQPEAAVRESQWQDARRRLMIQKLQATVVVSELSIDDDAVRAYLEEHRVEPAFDKRLRLRALMLESKELADRLHRDIRRRRSTFDEAVIAHARSPEQGVTLEVSWKSLTEAQREALTDLKAGQVSRPVEVGGDTFLFEVESWIKDPKKIEQEQFRLARGVLEQRYRQEANARLIQDLRKKTEVRLKTENLPFTYIPEQDS